MAINKNHEFEELNGIKCAIVEKNVTSERTEFLKELLEFNRFTVVVIPTPAPKAAAPAKPIAAPVEAATEVPLPSLPEPVVAAPETFTIGVTDVTFNSINAIFGRLLHTPDGQHVVTLAYWQQKEAVAHDEVPYFEKAHPDLPEGKAINAQTL